MKLFAQKCKLLWLISCQHGMPLEGGPGSDESVEINFQNVKLKITKVYREVSVLTFNATHVC